MQKKQRIIYMLHRKQKEKSNMDRSTRKYCYVQLGKERFDFNKDEEFVRYKYVCGEKLSRREWKKCSSYNMPYSFEQWKGLIKDKYKKYSAEQLNEFENYLKIRVFSKTIDSSGNNIIFSAILSAFCSALFSAIFQQIDQIRIVGFFLFIILIILIVFGFIYKIFQDIKYNELEKQMYKDYKDVIRTIKEENSI